VVKDFQVKTPSKFFSKSGELKKEPDGTDNFVTGRNMRIFNLIFWSILLASLAAGCGGKADKKKIPAVNGLKGEPDTSFNGTGIYTSSSGYRDIGYRLTFDSFDNIIVAGQSFIGGYFDTSIWWINQDGTPNNNWNGTGYLAQNMSTGGTLWDSFSGVAYDNATGKLFALGIVAVAGYDLLLASFNPDGTPNTSFSGDGVVKQNFVGNDYATGLTLDSQGRLVLACNFFSGTNYDFTAVRYLADGTLDTSYNAGGAIPGVAMFHNLAGGNAEDGAYGMAFDSQDRMILLGRSRNAAGNFDFAILRVAADGTLDTTFNSPVGFVTRDNDGGAPTSGDEISRFGAVDSQNRIVATGSGLGSGGDADLLIWRFMDDGTLDASFGNGGVVVYDDPELTGDGQGGQAVMFEPDGRIIIAGSGAGPSGNTDLMVWRFNENGTLDTTFGDNGRIVMEVSPGSGYIDAVQHAVMDAAGRVVLSGYTVTSGNSDENMFVVRIR